MRRGLRIRFNWDYISIKTSSPLEREKAASNFGKGSGEVGGDEGGKGERGGVGEVREKEGENEVASNWYGQRARVIWARVSAVADKICMFANQEVFGVTCPPAPSANTRLRRLRRTKRASKQTKPLTRTRPNNRRIGKYSGLARSRRAIGQNDARRCGTTGLPLAGTPARDGSCRIN